jgi:nitronate monooxygenase
MNRLCALLGLRVPILQAPMAGYATPALAAAVGNAGGLGALGSATLSLPEMAAQVAAFRGLSNAGINLNFFCHPEPVAGDAPEMMAALAPFFDAAGIALPVTLPPAPYPAFGPDHLNWLLANPPAVVSLHFGHPGAAVIARLRGAGIRVIATATTVAEARAHEAAGVDAVIAQGWEAGGHRGATDPQPPDAGVGLMALLPQVVDAVRVPVIAAGGIMDGRGIAAALMLGAQAVQMGTAFLRCPEAATSPRHRAALETATDDETHLTHGFSGRPARARITTLGRAMQDVPMAPYPLPRPITQMLAAENPFLLHGQGAPLARDLPAADLMARLIEETRAALADAHRRMPWISA